MSSITSGLSDLSSFFFWGWGVWVGVLVKIYRFLSASLICKLMECNIAYNGGPLFFVLPSTTFLQYPWPFSWDLLLADNFFVSHLQEECMDDYRAPVIPDIYTFNTMLDACIAEKKWDDFENIYRGMLHHGFHFNAKCHLRMILNASGAVKISSLSPCYFISWHKVNA